MWSAFAVAVLLAGAALSGCATTRSDLPYRAVAAVGAPVIPPLGLLYTNLRAPLSLDSTSFGAKRGTAVSHQIGLPPLPFPGTVLGLDLFAWGDASPARAAANGGITTVRHTDYELTVVLWIYRRFTLQVYGD
jgi:TRL-like protein family